MTTSAAGTWLGDADVGSRVYPEARPRRGRRSNWGALVLALVLGWLAPSCKNLNVYSLDQDMALGAETYQELLKEEQVVASGPQAEMVERVTDRLVAAAIAREPEFAGFEWEAKLLESETVNAFCLPGGKMAVYTGILPFTQDDTGLAVVMGHEIAHATRRHGTQKLTRAQGLQFVTELVALAGAEHVDPELSSGLLSTGLAVLVHLPYGRDAELEADHDGLLYMAGAGPEWLSTHPSDARRIEQIEAMLPEALQAYEAARAGAPQP
jgi:predicted Zn-dependent protease